MLEVLIHNILSSLVDEYSNRQLHCNWYSICAPLLTNLFTHAYGADFLQELLRNKDRKLAQTFNSSFRYIDDFLSLNNYRFSDYLHLMIIYPNQMSLKLKISLTLKSMILTSAFTLMPTTEED